MIVSQGVVIQDMTYNEHTFVIITCSCLHLFSTKPVNWDGLLFISMIIFQNYKTKIYSLLFNVQ